MTIKKKPKKKKTIKEEDAIRSRRNKKQTDPVISESESPGESKSESEGESEAAEISHIKPEVIMTTMDELKGLIEDIDNTSSKVHVLHPISFSGSSTEDAKTWLTRFNEYCLLSKIDGVKKILHFGLLMTGIARIWLTNLDECDKKDFEKIETKFNENFVSNSRNWITLQKIDSRRLKKSETCEKYVSDILSLGNLVGMGPDTLQQALIRVLPNNIKSL